MNNLVLILIIIIVILTLLIIWIQHNSHTDKWEDISDLLEENFQKHEK